MPLTLLSLRQESDVHAVEPCDEGFIIVRKPGAANAFDDIARKALNQAGETYAAFPRPDGRGGYESVLIVPIDT